MRVIIVGAGPTGTTLGAALARRRHRVVAFDQDPGPSPDGSWRRRGVMQFEQAHGFRPQVHDLLIEEWPAAWQAWLDLGADPVELPAPAGSSPVLGVRSRRSTYERALRRAATDVDGLTIATGRVEGLVRQTGRVAGVIVDGAPHRADLVIDASGRLSRLAPPPEIGGDTGMAYISRTFQRRAGTPPGPLANPLAWRGLFHGYDGYVFPHEHGHISVVLIRPTADLALGVLRHPDAFAAACQAIPALAEWTDPAVATPTSGVLVGGGLLNLYRRQAGQPGLVAVGDAVATTAPTAGRGLAMASMQIRALLHLLDEGADPATIAAPFGQWCYTWTRPWVEDHLAFDAEAVRRWQGREIELARPLTSAAIVAAAEADPSIEPLVAPFLAMAALPASLADAEQLARAVYETGWRQPTADGPTRDELVALARHAQAQAQAHTGRASMIRTSTARSATIDSGDRPLTGSPPRAAGTRRPDLVDYRLVHRAMTVDLDRLAVAAADLVGRPDHKRLVELRRYLAAVTGEVTSHHHVEDTHVWPAVTKLAGDDLPLAPLTADHERLDPLLQLANEQARTGDHVRQLAHTLRQIADLLARHIADEEGVLFPVIEGRMSPEEYEKLQQRFRANLQVRLLPFMVPWAMSHATAEERRVVLAGAPWPMRVLLAVFEPRFRTRQERLFHLGGLSRRDRSRVKLMRRVSRMHTAVLRHTGGRVGSRWLGGMDVVMLTTRGRKSGQPHTVALICLPDGGDLLVAASQGGVDREPQWWLNLLVDPRAEVARRGRRFAVTAERVSPAERPRLWARFVAAYPGFERYQAEVRREIAVVRLRPSEASVQSRRIPVGATADPL